MSAIRPRPEIQPLLLPKETVLYEAKQSGMVYILPVFIILLGIVALLPPVWDFLATRPNLAAVYPHARHVLYEMHYAWILILGGVGMMVKHYRQGHNHYHFITNLRVVEYGKTLLHTDVQYILLHHIKRVRAKATLMELLMHSGTIIMDDDQGMEHIEISDVSSPKDFKNAIMHAKSRFSELSQRAERDGQLKQVESDKTKRERKRRKLQERQEQQRKDHGGGY